MPSLKYLSARIKSVKSTQKTTKVMKLIAASKIASSTKSANAAQEYSSQLNHCLAQTSTNFDGKLPWSVVGSSDDATTSILMVISSDRGLCGGYNTNILKCFSQFMKDAANDTRIIAIGKKVIDHINYHKPNLQPFSSRASIELDVNVIGEIAQQIFDIKPSKFTIIYTHFISNLKQEISVCSVIPFTPDPLFQPAEHFLYEPDAPLMIHELAYAYVCGKIYSSFAHAAASENLARIVAMDNATKNAKEMISDLSLLYNRTRQAGITNELIEIISGVEALSN